jgi:glycosyltransferase involved in cell wall biosynthesis
VAEALACGTPVAAFARGGIPEIVDGTCAVLARPSDVCELAASIRAAMNPDRRAARRRAQDQCSLQANAVRNARTLQTKLFGSI